MLGDRKLAYYPNEGEEKDSMHYMNPSQPKDRVQNPLIYLDFETYVQGCKHCSVANVSIKFREPTLHPDMLPSVVCREVAIKTGKPSARAQ